MLQGVRGKRGVCVSEGGGDGVAVSQSRGLMTRALISSLPPRCHELRRPVQQTPAYQWDENISEHHANVANTVSPNAERSAEHLSAWPPSQPLGYE